MGGECGCCSSNEQRLHEQRLIDDARKPQKRKYRKKILHNYYNKHTQNTCCCYGEGHHSFKEERKFYQQEPTYPYKRKDDEKFNETPSSQTSLLSPKQRINPNIEGSPSPHPPYNHDDKQQRNKPKYKKPKYKKAEEGKSETEMNRFESVINKKQQSIQILKELNVIQSVYVPKNIYDRWNISHLIMKRLNIATDLHVKYHDNKGGMFCHIYYIYN